MNNRNFWVTLGLGTLSIALIALPGSSAKKQEAGNTPKVHGESTCNESDSGSPLQIVIGQPDESFEMAAQKVQQPPYVISLNRVQVDDEPAVIESDDDDVHVMIGPSGSWLGVGVGEVTPEKVKELKLPAERGALIGKIVADSPAAKAGLKENDVITEINGQRVEGTEQFRRMIREIPTGRTAQLTVWRDARSQNVSVTLGKSEGEGHALDGMMKGPRTWTYKMPALPALPDLSGLGDMDIFTMASPGQPRLGIDAESLDGEFGNYFGAPEGEGVLVRNVFANSAAAKAGLKVGDVITSLDGERIHNASELREKILTKKNEKSIKLGLLRNKSELTLSVELPAPVVHKQQIFSERTHI
jgi:serine protease Do